MGLVPSAKELLLSVEKASPQGFAWAKAFVDAQAKTGIDLDSFLKQKNIDYVTYIQEVGKGARGSPGMVLDAMRKEPAMAAEIAGRLKVSIDVAPTMPNARTTGEKAVADLAKKDPQAFALAKAFAEEQAKKPATQLGEFLSKHGIKETDFIGRVAQATSAGSAEVLKTMRAAGEFAEGVTKFISHSKFGKAFTAGGVLLGALTSGAHASTLPELGKTFAISAAGALDPTAIMGPSLAEHAAAHALGRRSEIDEMGIDMSKIANRPGIIKAIENNGRIDREQKFLLSPDHPAQLGSLKITDKSGQAVDVAAALKDPSRREMVMAEIDRRSADARTPEMKQLFADMKESAMTFVAMEDRRKPLPADVFIAQAKTQARQPAVATPS